MTSGASSSNKNVMRPFSKLLALPFHTNEAPPDEALTARTQNMAVPLHTVTRRPFQAAPLAACAVTATSQTTTTCPPLSLLKTCLPRTPNNCFEPAASNKSGYLAHLHVIFCFKPCECTVSARSLQLKLCECLKQEKKPSWCLLEK